jgi:thymidylate synthase ThyX
MKPKRTDELTDREKDLLRPYLTDVDANVFSIKNLNPEVIGAALARYSRAPTGFKETIVREFLNPDGTPNEVKGSEMIDRVVNKFGDESVAELAVSPICIEDISNLMTKIIEDCRIGGSPIEESTRYVLYDVKRNGNWRYVRPANIMQSGLANKYVETMDFIFDTYAGMVEPMKDLFRKRLTQNQFKIEVMRDGQSAMAGADELKDDGERKAHRLAYNFTMRSAACDVIRCILPGATQANLGLVANGRFFSGLISKLLSNDLDESQSLAASIRQTLNQQIPTFIKRAEKKQFRIDIDREMKTICDQLFSGEKIETVPEVTLLEDKPENHQIDLIASMIFPYVQHPTEQIRRVVTALPEDKRQEILRTYFGGRQSKRDRPGRALEFGYPINFDIVAGFAEYRDLQRHRMLTQQRQDLGVLLGYSIPDEIREVGKEEVVTECFGKAEELYYALKRDGFYVEAQYASLFNHFIRWNMGMNLRELSHFTELRTQKAGHPKYRRIARTMARLYLKRCPDMKPMFEFVDHNDYGNGITRAEQEARTARKSLTTGVFDDMDE